MNINNKIKNKLNEHLKLLLRTAKYYYRQLSWHKQHKQHKQHNKLMNQVAVVSFLKAEEF